MSIIEHAKREFFALGYIPLDQEQEDGPNKWIQQNVLELLEKFAEQGHSGSSAPYCVSVFSKLAMYKPLGPLTGTDDEWMEVGNGMWQNKRAGHVFKGADGRAYDLDAVVFEEPNGSRYTSGASREFVEFPYTPATRVVKRDATP